MFESIFAYSIVSRAINKDIITIRHFNLKDYGIGKHKIVDDTPYGGGVGMVLKVDVMDRAIQAARLAGKNEQVVLMDPKGTPYTQKIASEYAKIDHLILICGHYEGYDERIRTLVDQEVSMGDFVLSGGEIPAMAIIESVTRLIPGVLVKSDATAYESFSNGAGLEHAQYTRPAEYNGLRVPEVLLSGNFKKIEEFRSADAEELTRERRPDLINPKS